MGFVALLIAHFLGDFILQSAKMAQKKTECLRYFILHCVVYAGIILLALLSFAPLKTTIWIYLIIICAHAIIDLIRIKILKKMIATVDVYKKADLILFIADQIIHIVIILAAAYWIPESRMIENTMIYNTLVFVLLYIICLSPTAILIRKIFVFFSLQNDTTSGNPEELISNGYLIGVLERIILLTLGLNGQMGAIGFVLAAKSLARFKQLEDKSFAEKYLVGTLLSTTVSLFCITFGNWALK
jgi:hypothetical protein